MPESMRGPVMPCSDRGLDPDDILKRGSSGA